MTPDRPLIISVAINGSRTRKRDNPAVPYTAAEIGDEIVRAASAGAAIAHVHARTPGGEPTQEVEAFCDIVDYVRERSDIVLELSLGSPGFSAEAAFAPLALSPAMASFPMEIRHEAAGGGASLEATTRMLVGQGVRPSLAVTTPDSHAMVLDLVRRDVAGPVPCLAVSVEPFGSLPEAAARLDAFTRDFPPTTHWWLMKGGTSGATQYALRALAIGMGGHVRVGFEDRIRTYDDAGLAQSNAWYVERMVELAGTMGRGVATPRLARRVLGLD